MSYVTHCLLLFSFGEGSAFSNLWLGRTLASKVWGVVFTVQSFLNQNTGLLDLEAMKRGYILCKDVPL